MRPPFWGSFAVTTSSCLLHEEMVAAQPTARTVLCVSVPTSPPQLHALDGGGRVPELLVAIVRAELAGVCSYTHWSTMLDGPHRVSLSPWLAAQAQESLVHAQAAAELAGALGEHPGLEPAEMRPCSGHTVGAVLAAAEAHERAALTLYTKLLAVAEGQNLMVEEFARATLAVEERHVLELVRLRRGR